MNHIALSIIIFFTLDSFTETFDNLYLLFLFTTDVVSFIIS